jgi:ABC-2 type transport system ATP-binding protein
VNVATVSQQPAGAGTGVAGGAIVLSGLTKVYEPTPRWMRALARSPIRTTVTALDAVDLAVHRGEVCAVVGPNGAGKTTLFRILVGLTSATSGRGEVLGRDVEAQARQIRRVVGWMPAEDRSLLMRATCKENLHLHGRLQGMSGRELATAIPAILATVGLHRQRDAIVASLSAGMKARLRLARALLPDPGVLLLDEPTGAIDPVAAHQLLTLITDLVRERSLAVLISSHRLEEIEALRSNVVLLDRGQVRYFGDLDVLRRQWDGPVLELVLDAPLEAARLAAELRAVVADVELHGAAVRCRLPADLTAGELFVRLGPAAAAIRRVREAQLPLRDLIARIYSDGGVR